MTREFITEYKGYFIIKYSSSTDGCCWRVKANVKDDYALHHGSFTRISDAYGFIDKKIQTVSPGPTPIHYKDHCIHIVGERLWVTLSEPLVPGTTPVLYNGYDLNDCYRFIDNRVGSGEVTLDMAKGQEFTIEFDNDTPINSDMEVVDIKFTDDDLDKLGECLLADMESDILTIKITDDMIPIEFIDLGEPLIKINPVTGEPVKYQGAMPSEQLGDFLEHLDINRARNRYGKHLKMLSGKQIAADMTDLFTEAGIDPDNVRKVFESVWNRVSEKPPQKTSMSAHEGSITMDHVRRAVEADKINKANLIKERLSNRKIDMSHFEDTPSPFINNDKFNIHMTNLNWYFDKGHPPIRMNPGAENMATIQDETPHNKNVTHHKLALNNLINYLRTFPQHRHEFTKEIEGVNAALHPEAAEPPKPYVLITEEETPDKDDANKFYVYMVGVIERTQCRVSGCDQETALNIARSKAENFNLPVYRNEATLTYTHGPFRQVKL
jgi:hypothetical protein